uniref:Transmembrane protein n=1 Tax=Pithovirus LCPAC001 TaxID=2506585 RepID=A0A481Z236_9VIRU|nr:MAG: hypothetical protein LCPAC001_00240 [Pithovirus LCPAC001]
MALPKNQNGILYPGFEGKKYDKKQSNCPAGSINHGHPGLKDKPQVCCPKGAGVFHGGWDHIGTRFCKGQPLYTFCGGNDSCAGGACGHPGNTGIPRVCCLHGRYEDNAKFYCSGRLPGSVCNSDGGCSTNNCINKLCSVKVKKSVGQKIDDFLMYFGIIIGVIIVLMIIFELVK